MSFSMLKSWNNRRSCKRADCIYGRTWTRRIRWLESIDHQIKLKLEEGEYYREVLVPFKDAANTIWLRFKDGQPIDDCISILGVVPPAYLRSKKGKS